MRRIPPLKAKRAIRGGSASALWLRLGSIVALALCGLLLAAPTSQAQNAGGLGGFLQNLFNFGARPAPPPAASNASLRERAHKAVRKRQDFVPSTATRAPGTPGGAPVVKPTFFISVLGDSLAILAAQGLSDAFADKPEVAVTDLARDVSGLARNDYYDWPKAARDLIAAKTNIDVAVIMMGINDVQPLKDGDETLDLLSDKWRAAYGQRIDALLAPFRDAHIRVLWVGLPPMRDDRLNVQATALNEIYRDHAGKDGATYIDIWDAFADANGQFAAFGPDVEGQNAKLRNGAGGIYFTKTGARKLAQVLEPDIRRDLEKSKPQDNFAALPPDVEKEASAVNEEIRRELGAGSERPGAAAPAPKPLAGPVVSLTARPTSPGGALVNATDAGAIRTLAQQVYAAPAGSAPSPPAGRADDFAWPPAR